MWPGVTTCLPARLAQQPRCAGACLGLHLHTPNAFALARPDSFPTRALSCPPCRKGVDFVWDHIQPQADCMRAEGGGWAVDFVGRTEHIDDDLAAVLAELERRRPTEAPPVGGQHAVA